jgi:hypothetical protein
LDVLREKALQGWAKFLNPESLKSNLITASIFLAAYETLKASVIDRIRNFFTYEFDENGGVVSEDYESEVLSLDTNKNKSPLRASLLWLKQRSVISATDIELVDNIRNHRNELAHNLPEFLTTVDADVNVNFLYQIYNLVAKIDCWWIKEVEISANSDFDTQEVDDIDIQSGTMLFIQMMVKIAAGEDSSIFWDEFQKQTASIWK